MCNRHLDWMVATDPTDTLYELPLDMIDEFRGAKKACTLWSDPEISPEIASSFLNFKDPGENSQSLENIFLRSFLDHALIRLLRTINFHGYYESLSQTGNQTFRAEASHFE